MTLLTERKLSLSKLAQREGVNVSTCWRWAKRGVRGVRLETYSVGGRRWTSEEAFNRFVAGTTAVTNGGQLAKSGINPQRETAIGRAERELEQVGL